MSASNMTEVLVHEPINEDYEWIQYNSELRVIRSIKDDMYNMKSIIKACHSNKLPKDWFRNQATQELLDEFERSKCSGGIPLDSKSHENRGNLSIELRGVYVNSILVEAVAMWASSRYALNIFLMLRRIRAEEREHMEKHIGTLAKKVDSMKPRLVPANKQKNYKYMIWKEEVEEHPEGCAQRDTTEACLATGSCEDQIKLHLVRRNHRVFSAVNYIRNDPDKCWFFRDNLPIAMTPNENVKAIIKELLPGSDYIMTQSTVITYKKHLPLLLQKITTYFDEFQD